MMHVVRHWIAAGSDRVDHVPGDWILVGTVDSAIVNGPLPLVYECDAQP
jgi:hypothetical protein